MMYTGKVDHRFSDTMSLTGFYLYNKTDEPCANYWEPGLSGANRFIDPSDYLLNRRVHVLALNNTWLPSNNTVVTLRYGLTKFVDNDTLSVEFDPADARLLARPSSTRCRCEKFPQIASPTTTAPTTPHVGAIDPTDRTWYSWSANGTLSQAGRPPHLQVRRRLPHHRPRLPVVLGRVGRLPLRPLLHLAATRSATNAGNGNGFASFLLGYPSGQPGNESTVSRVEPVRGLHALLRRSTPRTTAASTPS